VREEAVHERERHEAFLKDLSERQTIQSEKLQKASKIAGHVDTIPVMVAYNDVESYSENLEKLLVHFEVLATDWRDILAAKLTADTRQLVGQHIADKLAPLWTSRMLF